MQLIPTNKNLLKESKRAHLEKVPSAILFCYEGKCWFTPVNINSIARVPLSCKNPSFTLPESHTTQKRIVLVAFKTLISHQER